MNLGKSIKISPSNDVDDDEKDNYYVEKVNNNNEWLKCYDKTYNRYYYYNRNTGESQWDMAENNEYDSSNVGDESDSVGIKHDTLISTDSYLAYRKSFESLEIQSSNDGGVKTSKITNPPQPSYYEQEELHEIANEYSNQDMDYYDDESYYYEDDYGNESLIHNQEESEYWKHNESTNHIIRGMPYEPRGAEEDNYAVSINTQTSKYNGKLIGGTNKDYLGMAQLYRIQRKYSDPTAQDLLCLLCRKRYATDVFFPCEHRCVCRKCIEQEHICSDSMLADVPDGYCNCSLCADIIKLILPAEGGAEVEKYWQWVYEEPMQPLPVGFLRDFRHSAAVIRAVYGNTNDPDSFENAYKKCSIS